MTKEKTATPCNYNFDTFICYRGSSSGNQASLEIAQLVYDAIKTDTRFGRVFFAPRMDFTYNYIEQAQHIIKHVTRFIVILNSHFFDDFYYADEVGTVQKNPQSSTCVELSYAFKYNRPLYPIRTSEFSWPKPQSETWKSLVTIFGDNGIGALRNRSNPLRVSQLGVSDAKEIVDYLLTPQLRTSKRDILESETNYSWLAKKHGLSREDLIKKLWSIYNVVIEKSIRLSIADLEVDFRAAKSLYDAGYKRVYHISSGYIYGINAIKQANPNSFAGRGYSDVRKLCSLPRVNAFYYWPIDCNSSSRKQESIGICAICFGTLLLSSWREEDQATFGIKLHGIKPEAIEQHIDGAIALLIALRDYEQFCWMSYWHFEDRGIAGSLNQTTLSLSTLIHNHFLSHKENLKSSELEKRYLYVLDGISFLIKNRMSTNSNMQRLSWGEVDENGGERVSYTLTCYCFDVIQKYLSELRINRSFLPKKLNSELKKAELNLSNAIDAILGQFESWCTTFTTQNSSSNETQYITASSKILYSLCGFLCNIDNIPDYTIWRQRARSIADSLLKHLLQIETDAVFNAGDAEEFEEFSFVRKKNWKTICGEENETYENCSILMYTNSILFAARTLELDCETKKKIIDISFEVLIRFNNEFVTEKDGRLMIRGKRPPGDLEYPLYLLYYYRILLRNYLLLTTDSDLQE